MITGFSIDRIEGKVESVEALGKQRFPRLNINLDSVTQEGQGKIKVKYTFAADYYDSDAKDAANIGHMKLGGLVELNEGKDGAASVMKRWNEKKQLPVDIAEEIINGLNFRCSATGTLVAYALGLIPPLVISTTKIQESQA